jgi:poly-gamma-glutamate synthesis protein (capsule biosynthesis protein)
MSVFLILMTVAMSLSSFTSSYEAQNIELIFMGDIVIDGTLEERMISQGVGYPFDPILTYIRDGDARFANLEAPISDRGEEEAEKYCTFRSKPGAENVLEHAGIDMVSLANNHCLDYGPKALNDTMEILEESGIGHGGIWFGESMDNSTIPRPAILTVKGLDIGFLAYTENVRDHWSAGYQRPGPLPLEQVTMMDDIENCVNEVDLLVVSIHWRKWPQYTEGPEDKDRILCRNLIDNGVDIIMGHGPHTVHEVEQYKDGLILYSLGNVAMNAGNRSSYNSYIAKVGVSDDTISSLELVPLKRETYRYVPMGTPIKRTSDQGYNVSYAEIWDMYENDIYHLTDKEKGWNEFRILIMDSPLYIKVLLIIAALLIVLLITMTIITAKRSFSKKQIN